LNIVIYYTIYHMTSSSIKFVAWPTIWPDTDYRIVPARPLLKRKLKQSIQILKERSQDVQPERIVGNGTKADDRRHIAQYPNLFRKFAEIGERKLDPVGKAADLDPIGKRDLIKERERLLAFVKNFGRLTDDKEGDNVHLLLDEAKQMRDALAFVEKHNRHPPAQVFDLQANVILNSRTGRIEQKIVPRTLLQAIWLQFIYSPLEAAKLTRCALPQCQVMFRAGPGIGRRGDSKFCSPEHQIQFHSLARSNPALREKRK
jgi:hypothetical protein